MGKLEDRIVASLVSLHDGEPAGAAEPMFVFPLSGMALGIVPGDGLRVVRLGEVAMVCRTDGSCLTSFP